MMQKHKPIKVLYIVFFSGNALYNLGKFEESIIQYDMALKIDPYQAKAYTNKGNIFGFISGNALNNLRKFNKSVNMFDLSLKINQNDAENYKNKSKVNRNIFFRNSTNKFRKIK